jgi:hypothetical protein
MGIGVEPNPAGVDASAKPKSKSKARSGQEIGNELWTELQTAYEEAGRLVNDIPSIRPSLPPALKRTGLDAVQDAASKYPREEVLEAFKSWLVSKYQPSLGEDVPIKFPLSVFAQDADAVIYNLRREKEEELAS